MNCRGTNWQIREKVEVTDHTAGSAPVLASSRLEGQPEEVRISSASSSAPHAMVQTA
ncbi:Hypothetical protein FKW44_024349 [Caligus rogercresseyi]|uniref:Uncharacterized protein n=1 Tax=Caligus rogercresseyi TaxID=217165 RepID=A0A7T8JTJ4_CALRO|nr:Hypothetical protein FKW44_024793 [Caligus rogercresseyi]QQP33098.1 Hypothetical protein FKW44_024349 [Caligus rogercresseyi]